MRTLLRRKSTEEGEAPAAEEVMTLPSVSPSASAVAHQLDRKASVRFRLAGRELHFAWSHVALPETCAWEVVIAVGAHRYCVRLSDLAVLHALLPLDLQPLPDISRIVVVAGLVEPIFAQLESRHQLAGRIESVEPAQQWGEDGAPRFALKDQAAGTQVVGTIDAETEEGWGAWLKLFETWPQRADHAAVAPSEARVRCVLGRTRLPIAQLRGIPVGGLLLIEEAMRSENAVGVVVKTEGLPGRVFRGRIDSDRMEIVSEESERPTAAAEAASSEAMLETAHVSAADTRMQNIDDLTVSLEFDLGEQSTALHVLKQVRPGFVFRLPQPITQASVRIQANGQTIGYGQLIAVGEVLGVRVTAFLQDDA